MGGTGGEIPTAKAAKAKHARLRAYAVRRLAAIAADRPIATPPVAAKPPIAAKPRPGKSKAARKDRRGAAQRAADAQRDARRASWARMHPQAAAAERAIRKDQAQMLADFGHKREGTPETHAHAARRNEGPLARLYGTGAIDVHQLQAAADIAAVAARIAAGVQVRTASFEGRVDRSEDGTFHEALGQVRREVAYGQWRDALPTARRLAVLEMIVGDARCDGPIAYTIVAVRHRMGARRAKAMLIDALDLWLRMVGEARREVDEEDLARAHARLDG